MTRVPVGPYLFNMGHMTVSKDLMKKTDKWDMITGLNMGLTAELLSEKNKYTREMLDEYAVRSHKLAGVAELDGFLAGEINPLDGQTQGGVLCCVDHDTSVRPLTDITKLSQLKTAFKEGGVITAGNSSPLTTGAAGMVLMSEEMAVKKGLNPIARIVSTGTVGTRPEMMGTGPVPASKAALKNAGYRVKDVDYWDINEAFSCVVLNAVDSLRLDIDRVNVNGGAISIGHPLGASGVRLVGTLARTLSQRNAKIGCAAACIGGGQGIATIIERI